MEINTSAEIGEKLKTFRRNSALSQEGLAAVSGVSIRTIQRIEKGLSVGSAFTITALAKALHINAADLMPSDSLDASNPEHKRLLKWMNLSALCILMIPLSNVIVPGLIFLRYRECIDVNMRGRKILSFQILWVLITVLAMMTIPSLVLLLFEPIRGGGIPLYVPVYIIAVVYNLYMTIRFALDLNAPADRIEKLPNIL